MEPARNMPDQEAPSAGPLSAHFRADSEAAIGLNALQVEARDQVVAKLARGIYRFVDVDCPLCGSASKQLLSEKDATGLPIETSLCLACGVAYSSRRLDDASLECFYANENFKLDRGINFESDVLFQGERTQGAHIMDVVRSNGLLEKLRDSLVVEIGCGPGGILAYFREAGFETIGFDIDPGVVAYGRAQGLELHHGGVDSARTVLGAKNRRTGLLIYSQALEHMADPRAELEKAKGLLDRESVLFIGVPGLRNIGPHYRYDLLHYLQPGHLIHFERFTLLRLLTSLSFEKIFADEAIDSIFRLTNSTEPVPATNPAFAMLSFLLETERKRSRLAAIKRARSAVGKILRPLVQVLRQPPAPRIREE